MATINDQTKVSIGVLVLIVPLFVWAANIESRLTATNAEAQSAKETALEFKSDMRDDIKELKQDVKTILRKLR